MPEGRRATLATRCSPCASPAAIACNTLVIENRPRNCEGDAERVGSAARGARPLKPRVRPPCVAVGREFFSDDLTDGFEGRPAVDVLKQRVVDQRLVVSTASPVYRGPKELDHRVVEANRDLGLPGFGLHDGSALAA